MGGIDLMVDQIEVTVANMGNGVERLVSSVVLLGPPFVPAYAKELDLDDERARSFLFAGARREGLELPIDDTMRGAVWEARGETHIRAWRA
jgi:hypothetical protein